jgi:uncharacterized protein with ParB-like and HNH nuclease domain
MKIQCIERDIRQILESGTYIIPRFQRPFSWEKTHIEEFWHDTTSDIKKDYFIGAFVTYNINNASYGVVDGQQRLTTITIALCAIRDKYKELGFDAPAKGVHRLIVTRDLDDKSQFVLKAETSYPYFQSQIQSLDKEQDDIEIGTEERALSDAYELLSKYVAEGVLKIRTHGYDAAKTKVAVKKWLDQIRDKLLSLKVISITLDNQDDAYLIFETLNTRGKDLTASDLAKNHILRLLPANSKDLDRAKDHWRDIQKNLEESKKTIETTTFLHHHWLSKYPFTTEKLLFKAIKDQVNKTNVKDVIEELKTDSVLYRGISEPESLNLWTKGNKDVQDSLWCISDVLNITIANPLLLTVLRQFKAKNLKDGQVREIFGLVEKYHYLYTTISALPSSGGVTQMYAVHAREIANAATANEMGICINNFKIKIKSKVPPRDTFITKFKLLNYSNTRQRDVIRYTLWKIYKSMFPAVDVDRGSLSIEHLAAQAAGGASVHFIGNLLAVPTKYNGDVLGDKSFAQKRRLLTDHGYALEAVIKNAQNWTNAEIEQRSNDLAAYAYDTAWLIK